MRVLIANTTFTKLMACAMVLNHYLTPIFSGKHIFSCFYTLTVAYHRTATPRSHRYFNNTIRLLRYRNSRITLCLLKRATAT